MFASDFMWKSDGCTYHVKYREQQEKIVECLVDCLGWENDEGEDVTNKTKAGNDGEEDPLNKEREGFEPWSVVR